MEQLLNSLIDLGLALWNLVLSLGVLLLPWLPLAAWIVFWTLCVNWVKLRDVLLRGGAVGLVLIGLVWILVWGSIAPPDQTHHILGLTVSNFVGKTVYVSGLIAIMLLSGAVQLSGCCDRFCRFDDDSVSAETHPPAH